MGSNNLVNAFNIPIFDVPHWWFCSSSTLSSCSLFIIVVATSFSFDKSSKCLRCDSGSCSVMCSFSGG